jgi:hypothetical protein
MEIWDQHMLKHFLLINQFARILFSDKVIELNKRIFYTIFRIKNTKVNFQNNKFNIYISNWEVNKNLYAFSYYFIQYLNSLLFIVMKLNLFFMIFENFKMKIATENKHFYETV